MGQKVHPFGFRLGVIKTWNSKWFENKNYAAWLHEDLTLKRVVKEHLANAGIASIEIERAASKVKIVIHTARPGIVIGKGGKGVDELKKGDGRKFPGLVKYTNAAPDDIVIDVQEIRKPDTNAQLIAEMVCTQLERRIAFRRAMKKAVANAMKLGAKGIRIRCAGRLGGAEIARVEMYREGRVPLHTLRADIEYGQAEARTTQGAIGTKVWIFKGEVLPEKKRHPQPAARS
ncbi:MAG: 30S ribosomal protein S3 [Deltaproteobacteria bacterium]|nr:30S ribosomal protein S3 [Deltaproteobacteria bacterium]